MKKNNGKNLWLLTLSLALAGVIGLLFAGQESPTRIVNTLPTARPEQVKEWAAAHEYVKRLPPTTATLKEKTARKPEMAKSKRVKPMAIKIPRGTTAQADPVSQIQRERTVTSRAWKVRRVGNPAFVANYVQQLYPDATQKNGWEVTSAGVVTVPPSALPGKYTVEFTTADNAPVQEYVPMEAIIRNYEFVVVAQRSKSPKQKSEK